MANISAEIAAFQSAVYGEDVRSAMISLANKLNTVVTGASDTVSNYNSRLTSLETVNKHNDIFAALRMSTKGSSGIFDSRVFRWEVGSISSSGEVANNARCRMIDYVPGSLIDSVSAKEGYLVACGRYNDYGDFINVSDWYSVIPNNSFSMSNSLLYRFIIKKTDNSTFSSPIDDALIFTLNPDSWFEKINNSVDFLYKNHDLAEAIKIHSDGPSSSYNSKILEWEIGGISVGGADSNNTKRCRFRGYISGNLFDSISAASGYLMNITEYDDSGTYVRNFPDWYSTWSAVDKTKFYRISIKKTDDSIFDSVVNDAVTFTMNENPIYDLLFGDLYSNATIISNSYYYENTGLPHEYNGWSRTDLIPISFAKIKVGGITTTGSTPSHVFYNANNVCIGTVHLSAQDAIIDVPLDAAYVGFSISNNDLSTFYATGFGVKSKAQSVEHVSKFSNLPSPLSADQIIVDLPVDVVKQNSSVLWRPDGGLMWSDGKVWRRAGSNALAISSNSYKTVKVSDLSEVNGYNEEEVSNLASITKLLSSVTVERYASNLNNTLTLLSDEYIEDNNNVLQVGDTVTWLAALNSGIIQSDNNAMHALARVVGYEIDPSAATDAAARAAFYGKMQETATLIGMTNTTTFNHAAWGVNSSPTDICKLLAYIHKNTTTVKAIWSLYSYTIVATGTNPRSWDITSTTTTYARELIPEFAGGKTGSGDYLRTYACVWLNPYDDEYYASTVLKINKTTSDRFKETRMVIDEAYAFLGQGDEE